MAAGALAYPLLAVVQRSVSRQLGLCSHSSVVFGSHVWHALSSRLRQGRLQVDEKPSSPGLSPQYVHTRVLFRFGTASAVTTRACVGVNEYGICALRAPLKTWLGHARHVAGNVSLSVPVPSCRCEFRGRSRDWKCKHLHDCMNELYSAEPVDSSLFSLCDARQGSHRVLLLSYAGLALMEIIRRAHHGLANCQAKSAAALCSYGDDRASTLLLLPGGERYEA
jgi:hypothetical protein